VRGGPSRIARRLRDASGQGTVEYALVLFAFLALVAGASSVWRMLESALPVEHALQSASHNVSAAAPGAFSDVFMY
jgi:Flp pilus assembly protein TadG